MAITAVTERLSSMTGTLDWKVRRTYTRRFQVFSNSNADTAATVLATQLGTGNSTHIPARLSVFPGDSNALCQSITVSRSDDPLIWEVECQYDTQFDIDPASTNENPLLRPLVVEFSFEKYTRALQRDLDDNAIVNSAKTPIDPPLEEELSIPILSISYNRASFSFLLVGDVQDCVNEDTWEGFDPGMVKIRGLTAKKQWENNQLYWAINWTLAVKWDGWQPRILDQGYYALDDEGNPLIIRDKFGQPLPNPSLLDGFGHKLDTTDPDYEPVYLDYTTLRTKNFTSLIGA